jgi:hypothetical protein
MTDPSERIRQILQRHPPYMHTDHARDVAEDVVRRLGLRREKADKKVRYVSAWFDDELTNLEGAE